MRVPFREIRSTLAFPRAPPGKSGRNRCASERCVHASDWSSQRPSQRAAFSTLPLALVWIQLRWA
eukprot:scaffold23194_cov30-Tisochrysis_lutea.AAC.4